MLDYRSSSIRKTVKVQKKRNRASLIIGDYKKKGGLRQRCNSNQHSSAYTVWPWLLPRPQRRESRKPSGSPFWRAAVARFSLLTASLQRASTASKTLRTCSDGSTTCSAATRLLLSRCTRLDSFSVGDRNVTDSSLASRPAVFCSYSSTKH